MKKLYIQPQTDVCEILPAQLIADSPGVTAPGQGIGYGGIDDGTKDPEVKAERNHYNVWDDDWREK